MNVKLILNIIYYNNMVGNNNYIEIINSNKQNSIEKKKNHN